MLGIVWVASGLFLLTVEASAAAGVMHQVLHWLHKLSDPEILALVLTTVTLAMMAAPQLGRKVLRYPERKERDEA